MTSDAGGRAVVSERGAMIAGMKPVLKDGLSLFCTTNSQDVAEKARPLALGSFEEDEGTTLILNAADAERLGFDAGLPMAHIVLEVFSALDGVGLTAGVSSVLADAGIPCNMVAAFHHDHVFVPAGMAQRALSVLQALQTASK
jgi:hypothetical protein